jgi:GWxTD domain-containing protein
MNKTVRYSLIVLMAFFASCRLYKLERKLPPDDADFISKVRYIITSEERKIYLELPGDERAKFKEEFWKRRDPLPETEINEYEIEYFKRLDEATRLFHGEGRPGWQTDRGRIFILFGPPTERQTYPMASSGNCEEIWYYQNFPVVFVDQHCSGSYILTAINLAHLQELNIAQAHFMKTFSQEKPMFDYNVVLKKISLTADRYEGVIQIEIPYKGLWFVQRDDKKLEAVLDIRVELKTGVDDVFWKTSKSFPIVSDEEELKQHEKDRYRMEIPIVLEGNFETLRKGKNGLFVFV